MVLSGMVGLVSCRDSTLQEMEAYKPEQKTEGVQNASLARQMEGIIKKGYNLNTPDSEGYTPLMNATRSNAVKELDYLLIKGAHIDDDDKGLQQILRLSASSEIRDLLISCATAKHKNITNSQRETIREELRRNYINPNDLNRAMFEAARSWRSNSTVLLSMVIALGGDVNAVNQWGEHILSATQRHDANVILLLHLGANPNAKLDEHGTSKALLKHIGSSKRITEALLLAGAQVKGSNALAKAAGAGMPELVRTLLEKGASVNEMTDKGLSVLEYAVQGRGCQNKALLPECVKLLLEAGAETTVKGEGNRMRSPISPGGMSIMPEVLRVLVDHGVDVNSLNSRGANYAQIAAYKQPSKENLRLLKDIIKAGANLSHKDDKGETFLFYALPGISHLPVDAKDETRKDEAEDLLEDYLDIIDDAEPNMADLDRNGNTALHLAVIQHGAATPAVVKFLLDKGVDPAVRNKFGRTALEAMLRGNIQMSDTETVRILAEVSPSPEKTEEQLELAVMLNDLERIEDILETKPSAEMMADALCLVKSAEALQALLQSGQADLRYDFYRSVAQHGTPEMIEVLSDVNQTKPFGNVWDSVEREEIARALLNAGVDAPSYSEITSTGVLKAVLEHKSRKSVNECYCDFRSGRTTDFPLTHIIKRDNAEMVRMLLDAGANIQCSPAPLAIVQDPDVAKLLIERGADVNWVSGQGETPLSLQRAEMKRAAELYFESKDDEHIETFRKRQAIVKMLEEAGAADTHPRKNEIKKALAQRNCQEKYKTVEFKTSGWRGLVRISEEAKVFARCGQGDTANIIEMTPDYIYYKWDRWGFGAMALHDDGSFHETEIRKDYSGFKANPMGHIHYELTYKDSAGKDVTMLINHELNWAVQKQTGEVFKIAKIDYHYLSPRLEFQSDKGETITVVRNNGPYQELNENVAKTMLRNRYTTIPHRTHKLETKNWRDELRFANDYQVVASTNHNLQGKVVEINERRIIINWDGWGYEYFYKHPDGWYKATNKALTPECAEIRDKLRRDVPSAHGRKLTLVHPGWTAKVNCNFRQKVAVQLAGGKHAAEIISFTKNSLTLKWDLFKTETYERRKDGRYYLAK